MEAQVLTSQRMIQKFSLCVLCTSLITLVTLASPLNAGFNLETLATHSHLVIPVDPGVSYSVEPIEVDKKTELGIRIRLKNLQSSSEQLAEINKKLQTIKDVRTEKVTFRTSNDEAIIEVKYSKAAMAAGVEFFDYRSKNSSELLIDFWTKKNLKTDSDIIKPIRKHAKSGTNNDKATILSKNLLSTSDPNTKDPLKGCGYPFRFETDSMVYWKPYHVPFNYKGYFKIETPDTGYEYSEDKPKKGEDDKTIGRELAYYRLAIKLYKENKLAISLRTADYFLKTYPKSTRIKEIEFLKANALLKLSKSLTSDRYFDDAVAILRQLILKEPASRKSRHAFMYLVQELLTTDQDDKTLEYALFAAESGEQISEKENKLHPWVFRLASAEMLFRLTEYDRAARAYQYIMDQDNAISPEAAFRLGEAYSARKLWDRSIYSFENAFRKYPKEAERYPTAWFNLAEAYFRKGMYSDSEKTYEEYIRKFPLDYALWAAELRYAELQHMKVADKDIKEGNRVHALYEHIVNRYPYTPGSQMAQLRIAGCYPFETNRQDGVKAYFTAFFKEHDLKKFESPLINQNEAEMWLDYAETRFFYRSGQYELALGKIDKYYTNSSRYLIGKELKKIYSESASELIKQATENEKPKVTLELDKKYSQFIEDPKPFGYGLSLIKVALKLNNTKEVLERINLLSKRIEVASSSEKDTFYLLKYKLDKSLGEKGTKLYESLNRISDSGDDASAKLFFLAQTSFDVSEYSKSMSYDSDLIDSLLFTKLKLNEKIQSVERRIEATFRLEKFSDCVKYADRAILQFGVLSEFEKELTLIKEFRAQSLLLNSQYKEAIQAFQEIIQLSPEHPRKSEFEFQIAKSLLKLGSTKEAFESFRKIAQAPGGELWKKSAQAEIDQLQWESNLIDRNKNNEKDRRSSP